MIEYLNGMNLNCTVDTVNKVDDQLSQKAVIHLGQTVRISVALIYSLPKQFLGQGHFHGFPLYISRPSLVDRVCSVFVEMVQLLSTVQSQSADEGPGEAAESSFLLPFPSFICVF